jgi:hypothetical protein
MRVRISAILAGALVLFGCSGLLARKPSTTEAAEEALYSEVSEFYCARNRWPLNFDELTGFVAARTPRVNLATWFPSAEISSPRAIVANVQYDAQKGSAPRPGEIAVDKPEVRRIALLAPPTCGPASDDPTMISMAGGRVSFRLPDGFEPLDRAAVSELWKDAPKPDVAWSHVGTKVLVAVRFGEAVASSETLSDLKDSLEAAYTASVPGLNWIVRDIDRKSPVPHVIHEFESDSSRGRQVTYSVSAPFDGRLLTLQVIGSSDVRVEVEKVATFVQDELLSRLGLRS